MRLSIIIPVFNRADTIERCVNRLSALLRVEHEILIIDDGSTDGSAAICDQLRAQNLSVRCVHQPNGGVSSARNRGLELASGDFIWFVDSDDEVLEIEPSVFEEAERTAPGMILFGMEFCYFRGERLLRREVLQMPQHVELTADQIGQQFAALFRTNYLSPVWNKLFRRKLLVENEIRFDQKLTNYEDLAFSLHALSCCSRILVLPDVCYHYITDYDHDRTVDRIAVIDELAANTDRIAKQFCAVSERLSFDVASEEQLNAVLCSVYLGLFSVKAITSSPAEIRRQCRDFSADPYLIRSARSINSASEYDRRLYGRILKSQAFLIWLDTRYRTLRNRLIRTIKPLLKRRSV